MTSKDWLIKRIQDSGNVLHNKNSIVVSYTEGDRVANVYFDDKMYSNVKISLEEVDEKELVSQGVRVWRTYEAKI